VQVGLVDVAALAGNAGGGVACREKVSGVVEPHQPGGAFGGDAELGPEAGPKALAAPAHLVRQAVDPQPPPAGQRPPPRVGDLRIDSAGGQPPAEDLRRDREPFVPRRGGYPQVAAGYTPVNGYFPLAPWAGMAVTCAWAALALALAAYLLRRRDA
jgi:hypothetical protein